MENYTKYKLKSSDELASVLDGKDNLFVIACNKCFKEFETVDEPDCDEFLKFAADQGKNVTGSAKFDFLCNKMHTERKLQDLIPEGTENVVVISCGLGIQTVADLAGKPVVAASNTLNYRGHHGMALTKKSCDACAQCYLNITGGVCPIVDCSKSLVNGQCGGAKNGKCEVDPNKDCAWEKIYQRLAKQGRLEEFLNQPVQVRDFSKVNFKVINDYVKSIREERLDGYYGGVHPSERKEFSEHIALKKFPDPKTVVISMSQHLGAPANPIVQVGDTVKVGQKIGEAAGFISAPVHSSVSGTVVAVEPRMHGTRGSEVMAVVIESDGKNTLHESVQPHGELDNLTPDEIIDIIREAGIVGMGGAGFTGKRKTDHDCIFKGSDRNNKGDLVSNAVFKKYTWAKRSSCSPRQGCEEKRFPCDGTSGDLRSGSPLSGKDQHHAACLWIDSRSDKQCSNQSTTSGIRTGAGTG